MVSTMASKRHALSPRTEFRRERPALKNWRSSPVWQPLLAGFLLPTCSHAEAARLTEILAGASAPTAMEAASFVITTCGLDLDRPRTPYGPIHTQTRRRPCKQRAGTHVSSIWPSRTAALVTCAPPLARRASISGHVPAGATAQG